MIASLKKLIKWGPAKTTEQKKIQASYLLAAFIGALEDILFWRYTWFSLSFLFLLNVVFFVCVHEQINLLVFIFCFYATILIMDALECWLKYKHRTTFLKRLADYDGSQLQSAVANLNRWTEKKIHEFIYLREVNNTKAFLLVNIILSIVFIIGKYISGYLLTYLICMFLCFVHKLAPPVKRLIKKIQVNAESDIEFEGLIPEVSEVDIKLLSIEPEQNQIIDERQSLDYWKPDDVPIEEISDSSDNSSSLVTNLSMEKMHSLEKDVDTSDSSEDEYMPREIQKDKLQTTLEVIQPSSTWGSTAYNAFFNLTGAVANMVYATEENKRQRVSSIDSSDGFEMIDKNDLN